MAVASWPPSCCDRSRTPAGAPAADRRRRADARHRRRARGGRRTVRAVQSGTADCPQAVRGAKRPRHLDRGGRRRTTRASLPFIANGLDGGTRASLALMHLAVAAVLIPGLGGRSPGAGDGVAGGRPPTLSTPRTAPDGSIPARASRGRDDRQMPATIEMKNGTWWVGPMLGCRSRRRGSEAPNHDRSRALCLVPPAGFEPATPALGVRSPTQPTSDNAPVGLLQRPGRDRPSAPRFVAPWPAAVLWLAPP
ncbi:DUF6069 family protein [Streptomyces bungoensis]|uniref:DUF6069 family protein n=1 Tax=Streptomyces bungoensis TaxID=285568 RepID=UPI00369C1386